jgi:hypothetical protein
LRAKADIFCGAARQSLLRSSPRNDSLNRIGIRS